jgi:hypothetical protein
MISNWRKSTYSAVTNCVEVATAASTVSVRDTKLGLASPVLTFSPAEWDVFLDGVKGKCWACNNGACCGGKCGCSGNCG